MNLNPLNYATLEASQRLEKAGIVLETEAVWTYRKPSGDFPPEYGWDRQRKNKTTIVGGYYSIIIPDPSMAEVWRELPNRIDGHELGMGKVDGDTYVFYKDLKDFPYSANPTDALVNLLIWVKEQRKEK